MTTEKLEKAIAVLARGGIVVFPTETAYGLAADATQERAVEKVQALKGRENWKTPPLIVADRLMAEKYVVLTPLLCDLVDQFWPGPLTIIANCLLSARVSKLVIRNHTIALRVSSHPVARDLSHGLGAPIVSTSANRAGEGECYTIQCVHKQFDAQLLQPDLYLDAGPLEARKPSTIVQEAGGRIEIVRQGEIMLY